VHLAVAAREFGAAVPIAGIVRDVQDESRPDHRIDVRCRAFVLFGAIRLWVSATNTGGGGRPRCLPLNLLENLRFWLNPLFVTYFVYFLVGTFRGSEPCGLDSAPQSLRALKAEPEIAVYLILIVGAAALGSLDVWRYLLFALPAVVLLATNCLEGVKGLRLAAVGSVVVAVTLLTQEPFKTMNLVTYFVDWFPLYVHLGTAPEILAST